MDVERELFFFLTNHITHFKEKKYILAVSGGLDSMVLLHSFRTIFNSKNLICAHFNHEIRGEESLRDEKFVIKEASFLDIKTIVGKRHKTTISEESLRRERYEFLEKVRDSQKADYIVFAHHSVDELETFIMRLIRGTGLHGLRLIPPIRNSILRPFLRLSKTALEKYVIQNKIKYIEDSSNYSDKYFRNRIRHSLIPKIEELSIIYGSNEKFYKRFNSLIYEIYETTDYITNEIDKLYRSLCIESCFWIKMKRKDFLKISKFFQAKLLIKISKILGNPLITRKEIYSIMEAINNSIRHYNFTGKIEFINSCDWLFFSNASQRGNLNKGIEICVNNNEINISKINATFTVMGLDKFEMRFFKPGDRFKNKKIKEIFLKKRIPRPERSILPLLVKPKSNEVIWYLGLNSDIVKIKKCEFPFSFPK